MPGWYQMDEYVNNIERYAWHAIKIVTIIIFSRTENKIQELLKKDQFGFKKELETIEAIFRLYFKEDNGEKVRKDKTIFISFIDVKKRLIILPLKYFLQSEASQESIIKYEDLPTVCI